MNLVADESVDHPIVARLREDGHDVLYVAEFAPSTADDVILAEANQRNALLVTADKDFGELVFRMKRLSAGVVLLRFGGLAPQVKAELAATAIRDHAAELHGKFSVISPGLLRVRPTVQ